jgi:hypothetical protein
LTVKSHGSLPFAVTESEYCEHVPVTPALRYTRIKYIAELLLQWTGPVAEHGASPSIPFGPAYDPFTHQSYDVIALAGPEGESGHAPPRVTSKMNSSFGVGAAKSMLTWYEFVFASAASTVFTIQTSTSVSDDSVPLIKIGAPTSLTDPAFVAVPQLSFGSPASVGHVQPCSTGPGGYAAKPGLHAPTAHVPPAQPQPAFGGGGPFDAQSAFGSPSSLSPLQLSSFALHVSATGTAAVQPSHFPFAPLHVSIPEHSPFAFSIEHACVTPSRFGEHGHEFRLFGTQNL